MPSRTSTWIESRLSFSSTSTNTEGLLSGLNPQNHSSRTRFTRVIEGVCPRSDERYRLGHSSWSCRPAIVPRDCGPPPGCGSAEGVVIAGGGVEQLRLCFQPPPAFEWTMRSRSRWHDGRTRLRPSRRRRGLCALAACGPNMRDPGIEVFTDTRHSVCLITANEHLSVLRLFVIWGHLKSEETVPCSSEHAKFSRTVCRGSESLDAYEVHAACPLGPARARDMFARVIVRGVVGSCQVAVTINRSPYRVGRNCAGGSRSARDWLRSL